MKFLAAALMVMSAMSFSANCEAAAPKPLSIEALSAPVPVTTQSKTLLVYELYIVNEQAADVTLDKVTVIDLLKADNVLASYEGRGLGDNILLFSEDIREERDKDVFGLKGISQTVEKDSPVVLKKGMTALVYIWIEMKAGSTMPKNLLNHIAFNGSASQGYELKVSGRKPVLIAPPLKGKMALASGAAGADSYHRRAALPMYGKIYCAQRFAVDWVIIDDEGRIASGDIKKNDKHYCFGKEIYSVADGVVVSVLDGIQENVAGQKPNVTNVNELEGNHIVTDIGNGNYVFYAHLQPDSLKVKPGDKVSKGQVLALLGNTGNSDAPHLHIHVSDGTDPIKSDGLPFLYESFELVGKVMGEPDEASNALRWERKEKPVLLKESMPLQDDVVNL